jgi:hypothetical protein
MSVERIDRVLNGEISDTPLSKEYATLREQLARCGGMTGATFTGTVPLVVGCVSFCTDRMSS